MHASLLSLSYRISGKRPALLLFWLLLTSALAQAQTWQTALAASRAYSSQVRAIATDNAGNVYLAGDFRYQVTFGATTLMAPGAGPYQAGAGDIFIAKWSPVTRDFVWAQRAGGSNDDGAYGIAVSGSSIYVTGYISSATADFGPTTLASRGSYDAFITKLTDNGATSSFTWTQQIGGTSTDQGIAIAVSGTSIYATGAFVGTAGFGTTGLTYSASKGGMFVAKLTDSGATGSFGWVQQANCTSSALAAQGANVYVTGNFTTSTVQFGSTTLTNAGTSGFFAPSNVFVAKLTDAGATSQFTWAKQAGGMGTEAADVAEAIAVKDDNVYIAGIFSGIASTFGSTVLTNANQNTSARTLDMFVAKLSDQGTAGNFVWARRAGGPQDERANGLAVSGPNVYVAGSFYSPVAGFGGINLANASASTSLGDIFVTKLTDVGASGDFTWAQQAGGADYDMANTVAVYNTTVYAAGGLSGATAFGALTLPASSSELVAFIASLRDATGLPTKAASALAGVSVLPNPARANVTVQLPATTGAAQATITLRNMLGQVLRSCVVELPASGLAVDLPVSEVAGGMYLVQVQVGPAQAICRLAIE